MSCVFGRVGFILVGNLLTTKDTKVHKKKLLYLRDPHLHSLATTGWDGLHAGASVVTRRGDI